MDFPFANAPDIIRANQKDAYVELSLRDQVRDLVQWAKGTRFLHSIGPEIDSGTSLLYLGLTTLLGARTLGEEYTDVFYLTSNRKLPSWKRKAGFVLTSGLLPLLLHKYAHKLKSRVLARLEQGSLLYTLVDEAGVAAFTTANLALFYFAGAYYQLGKRVFGLRYAFGHRVNPLEPKGSYEFLGVLMVAQAFIKLGNSLRKRYIAAEQQPDEKVVETDLEDESVMPWLPEDARVCNLCLDPMKSPAITLCGHLFCWSCVAEWCRDHSECPLCRQACDEQNLLVLQP